MDEPRAWMTDDQYEDEMESLRGHVQSVIETHTVEVLQLTGAELRLRNASIMLRMAATEMSEAVDAAMDEAQAAGQMHPTDLLGHSNDVFGIAREFDLAAIAWLGGAQDD